VGYKYEFTVQKRRKLKFGFNINNFRYTYAFTIGILLGSSMYCGHRPNLQAKVSAVTGSRILNSAEPIHHVFLEVNNP
jgi:hypothetical protein